jgi:hypothetical protein
MKTSKKILSMTGVVLSIIVLVVCVFGMAGVWVARANINQAVNRVFGAADLALGQTASKIDDMTQKSQDLTSSLTNLSTEIESKGKTVQDNPVVLLAVNKALDGKLIPAIVQLDSTARDVYAGISKVEYALNALSDSFLFRDRDGVVKQTAAFLSGVTSSMDELDSGLRDLQATATAQKSDITDRVVDRLTQPIQRVTRGVNAAQSMLTVIKAGLLSIQTRLSTARDQLLWAITLFTVFLTLLLAWLAYTQYVTARTLLGYYRSLKSEPGGTTAAPETAVVVTAP